MRKLFLFIPLLLALASCYTASEPMSEAEAREQAKQAILDAISTDTQGDESYQAYYFEPLNVLETKCQESLPKTVRLTIEHTDKLGYLGEQFAWLNTLELAARQVEDNTNPVECAPIISALVY